MPENQSLRLREGAKIIIEGCPFEIQRVTRSGLILRPHRWASYTVANGVMQIHAWLPISVEQTPEGVLVESRPGAQPPPMPAPPPPDTICERGKKREKKMRTITYFPLWLMLLYWLLWNSGRSQAERLSALESAHRITLLEYLRRSLPIPRNRVERFIVGRVLLWIDRELHTAATRPTGISPAALRLVCKKS